jgi:hypothetical protein
LNTCVRAINERAGRAAVRAVELHSAPTGHGERAALARSLVELADLDWQDALLTVEHCDSASTTRAMQKGYLPLEDELAAAGGTDGRFAVTINWGRSAIDGRSAATATQHITRTADAGLLGGLMFSGVAADTGPYGDAWTDAHPPPAGDDGRFAGLMTEPASLLTPAAIAAALRAAGGQQQFTGLKIAAPPGARTPPARLAYIRDALRILSTVADDLAIA